MPNMFFKKTVAGDGTFNKCKTILITLPKVIRTHG